MSVFTSEKLVVISEVCRDPFKFQSLDENFRGDREVVLAVVQSGAYELLKYASESLLTNKEFIMACVDQEYKCINYAHEILRNDKGFMRLFLKKKGVNPATIRCLPESLKHNRDFILAVVKEFKDIIKFVPEELKTDKSFIINALRINGKAIALISDELKADPDVFAAAIASDPHSIRHLSSSLKDDEEFMTGLIRQRGDFCTYASDRLKAKSDFMVFACRHYAAAIQIAPKSLLSDKIFCLRVLDINGLLLEFLPVCSTDLDCVTVAVRRNVSAFAYASPSIRSNREFIKLIVSRNARVLAHVLGDVVTDDEFMLELIQINGLSYEYASERIRNDRDVIVAVMRQTGGRIFWNIPENFRQDPEIMTIFAESIIRNGLGGSADVIYRNLGEVMSEEEVMVLRDLDIDTKYSYLRQKVQLCTSNPAMLDRISIQIKRDDVLEESFRDLNGILKGHRKYCPLNVRFEGENGLDGGGLTREFFSIISSKLVDPEKNLFKSQHEDNGPFQPNGWSHELPDCDEYYRFIGRLVGKAITDNENLDSLVFTTPFLKHMIGSPITLDDLKSDASSVAMYNSLKYILDNPVEESYGLQFTHDISPRGGGTKEHLVQDLRDLRRVPSDGMGPHDSVTDENKEEFVNLKIAYCTTHRIERQIHAFLEGLYEFIPRYFLTLLSPQELAMLINGQSDVDLQFLQNNTIYESGYSANDEYIQCFWDILAEEGVEFRQQFLSFVTGSKRIPVNHNDLYKLHICKLPNGASLPVSHTCHRQLNLPQYSSREELKTKLLQAVQEGIASFNFL